MTKVRLLKQTLGWTKPRLRDPHAADTWTWLILTAHTQLRLARGLVSDLRRPWEKPAVPERLTPARVRRGFRNLHTKALPRTCAGGASWAVVGRVLGVSKQATQQLAGRLRWAVSTRR
ncbi:hypothetical protein ACGFNP_22440 [Nonomuraea sp. NPDC049269]|uniref:hypothetical protein n=1 Tax=Nonomuraea sp. NPDC049269 TaxID=3364349 RepID=UPI003722386D